MRNITLLLVVLVLGSSCSQKSSNKPLSLILGDLFSTRAQKSEPYVGLVQLQLPALLSSAKIVNGKAVISEEDKKALLEEQEVVIEQLKALSADIKILTTYKLVLNAISFVAPSDLSDKITRIEGVSRVVSNTSFDRPVAQSTEEKVSHLAQSLDQKNSVLFIGGDYAHKLGFKGQGMRVGVIDTGVDYTHAMLGGPGKKEIYESINPDTANEYFPNAKVVGGVDFVGTKYNTRESDIESQTPVRDLNPIDEAEHGTHVSGSVAGIGDGKNTYSGVAPEANIYGLKVFGKEGSTSDVAVIQALEYAADTSETLDISNRLDVVNLSLGGGFGKPKILYTEAIKNLTRGGTVVVASAGNSGDNPYIVGAPSTSDEAISVAAAIDYMPQNISIPAVEVKLGETLHLVEKVEGTISVPAEDSKVSGTLIYIGNGATEIPEATKLAVKGKIALMDRGAVSFVEKLKVATDLGAIGVVVANNQDGNPIQMGGEGHFDVPAVMVTKALGNQIKDLLNANSSVEFNFSPGRVISRDDLIDQITDFSSRGPRSMDSLIKPEIAGPGANIISAKAGSGTEGVMFSGTSMSGPHLAGVMVLLKQANPTMTVAELKAKVLNNTKIMMKNGVHVPVSLQGSGRVQIDQAFKSKVLAMPATLSLGEVSVSSKKTVSKQITLTNSSDKDVLFTSKTILGKNVTVSLPGSFKVKAKSSTKINISFTLSRANADQNNIESDGFVILQSADGNEKIHLPFLAVLNKVSNIGATDFITLTNSKDDLPGSEVQLTLKNAGQNDGDALIFNLLGTDDRKTILGPINLSSNSSCDLEAAGMRIVSKEIEGHTKKFLQIGVKLYDTVTMWQPCDISVQFDNNGDGVADQELVGTQANNISGIESGAFASILLDAKKAREIRADYEAQEIPRKNPENYTEALLDAGEMKFYDHASVAMIEIDVTKIQTAKNGTLGMKLSVSSLEANDTMDDYLASHEKSWQKVNLADNAFAFYDMPELATIKANDLERVSMKRGNGKARLLVLYPHNAPAATLVLKDAQSQILVEKLQK